MEEKYIAALEIGSSKITGAVGVYSREDSVLKVLAVEQEESRDSVRYGIIHNPEEVAQRVARIIERLESNPAVAPRRIKGIVAGLSGRSMHSVNSDVQLYFPEETEVTGEMLKRLNEDAASLSIDSNMEILDIVPRSYQIDGMETSSPKGAMGKSITAMYDIIVGRNDIKRNLLRALAERGGLSIRKLVITALAAADIVLSDEEKRLGCMLVDMGAETTSVSIYRNGSLCYYTTLPLGGRNITRDLTSLSILEENAEEIKCENGRAVARETPSSLNINGIKLSDVSNIVVARAEEIVANIVQQINYAGLTEKDLPAGIVCIGAGANLNGILELLENQSGLNARSYNNLPPYIRTLDPKAKRHNTIETVAILNAGIRRDVSDCLELPPEERPEPETPDTTIEKKTVEPEEGKIGGFFNKIGRRFSDFFASPADDDSELD